MSAKYHINPRFRAYGKARLDVTLRAKDEQEWQEMWKESLHAFPFNFANGWKFCLEYKVVDFAAEVGFFIDVLGFTVKAFSPRYAQFTSPGEEICFNVLEATSQDEATDPDSLRLILQLSNAGHTLKELESRGVSFEKPTGVQQEDESVSVGYFRTPHGVRIDLWDQDQASSAWDEELDGLEQDEIEGWEVDDSVQADDELEAADDSYDMEALDDDEADRLIDELLGLSEDSTTSDDDPGITETDEEHIQELDSSDEDEEISYQASPDRDSKQEPLISPGKDLSRDKSMSWKPSGRSNPTTVNQSRLPAGISRGRSANWPTNDDRRNGELSYEEIEDE